MDPNPFGELALRCPPIDVDEAAAITRDLFGREGKVCELGSNQDRNYRVDTPEGRFVLRRQRRRPPSASACASSA